MVTVSFNTLLEQKFQRAKLCQTKATVTPIILPIKYAHILVIAVSFVTVSVPCHRTRVRVVTFLPVFP